MNISIDYGYRSINHDGEEVCGDRVEHKRWKDGFIGVLADGMGSGVKANILSTMGSAILSTMLLGGEKRRIGGGCGHSQSSGLFGARNELLHFLRSKYR